MFRIYCHDAVRLSSGSRKVLLLPDSAFWVRESVTTSDGLTCIGLEQRLPGQDLWDGFEWEFGNWVRRLSRPLATPSPRSLAESRAPFARWALLAELGDAPIALEALAAKGKIRCFARNERLEFNIPYEFLGNDLSYFPDFLVQVREGFTLILEIKGQEDNQDLAKYEAAKRWVRAVNHWGKEGQWGFVVCKDPQTLAQVLEPYVAVKASQ
jgi:hypothetical protein